jgi:general secretion pathway protein J
LKPIKVLASHGFTLIEVLVAIVLVTILSLLAWRGLDGMGRAAEQTATHEQSLQRIEIALAQWTADLDAVADTGLVQALDFDGQRLRLTRRSSVISAGVVVVAWTLRSTERGHMIERWSSPPLMDRTALQMAWNNADRWSRTPLPEDEQRTAILMHVTNWQLFYYRNGAASNALSAIGTTTTSGVASAANTVLPDGIQLVLDLPAGQAVSGKLTHYWVQPTLGATQ